MSCQCKTERQRSKCMWWVDRSDGIIQINKDTKETRFLTGCFPEVFFRLMEFVIFTNESAAGAVEQHRDIVENGFKQLISLAALTGNGSAESFSLISTEDGSE